MLPLTAPAHDARTDLEEFTDAAARGPWNTGGGIRPVGPFPGLRDAAYCASQRARLTA